MKQAIPKKIKLLNFAKKNLVFEGNYQIKDLPRINALATNINDFVKVKLNFYLEKNKIPCIRGDIELDIVVECQRCLDGVKIHLKPNFNLAFLKDDKKDLGANFEIIKNNENEFEAIKLIEDEILISMPMIAKHNYKCTEYINKQNIHKQKNKNPFTILKKLKHITKE